MKKLSSLSVVWRKKLKRFISTAASVALGVSLFSGTAESAINMKPSETVDFRKPTQKLVLQLASQTNAKSGIENFIHGSHSSHRSHASHASHASHSSHASSGW